MRFVLSFLIPVRKIDIPSNNLYVNFCMEKNARPNIIRFGIRYFSLKTYWFKLEEKKILYID